MKARSGPWEQESCKHRDSRREALVAQIPLQPLPLSQQDGVQAVSEEREAAGSLRSRRRCEELSRRPESQGYAGVYRDCRVSAATTVWCVLGAPALPRRLCCVPRALLVCSLSPQLS